MFKIFASSENTMYNEFAYDAGHLVQLALKLHHAVLFRECFIHTVWNWHDAEWMERELPNLEKDGVLWRLLSEGHADLSRKILLANKALLVSWQDHFFFRIDRLGLMKASSQKRMPDSIKL